MAQSFGEMLAWVPKSRHLGDSLSRAHDYARGQGHQEIAIEHFLLALLNDPDARAVLEACGVSTDLVAVDVEEQLAQLTAGEGGAPVVSTQLSRILEYAVAAARQSKRRDVNGAIVLAAIVGEGNSSAAEILRQQGLTFDQAIKALQAQSMKSRTPNGAGSGAAGVTTESPPPPVAASTTNDILEAARRRISERSGGSIGTANQVNAMQEGRVAADGPSSLEQAAPATLPAATSPPPEFVYNEEPSPEGHSVAPMTRPSSVAVQHHGEASVAQPPAPGAWAPPMHRPQPAPVATGQRGERPRTAPPPLPPPVTQSASVARHGPASPPWTAEARVPGPPGEFSRPAPAGGYNAADASYERAPHPHHPQRRTGPHKLGEATPFEAGELSENVPRRMRVGKSELVEIRIARVGTGGLQAGMHGSGAPERHDIVVTKAMSVRLRAPDGGFFIETASPETQWIENTLGLYGGNDFASWRFVVTPQTSGQKRLQVIVSARTVGSDGLTAETALPDQVITVKVRANYARAAGRWLGWAAAAIIGGVLARFGEGLWAIAGPVVRSFVGPI